MKAFRNKQDVQNFCSKHKIEYTEKALSDGGTELRLAECAFDSNHKNGDAKLLITATGVCSYKCHHNSCKGKKLPDFIRHYEPDFYKDNGAIQDRQSGKTVVFTLPRKMSEVEKKEIEWLVPCYIPRKAITILAADGGTGKTTIECALAAAISSGNRPFLCGNPPKEWDGQFQEPQTVLFLSGEDFAAYTLAEKIEKGGGDLNKVFIIDPSDEALQECVIGSDYLQKTINETKPALVIIDPLQAFIPEKVNMGYRNQMRHALLPIDKMASDFNMAVLIAAHSNKRENVSGRGRVSDSSDIWDMARSVLMVGLTQDLGIRYVSHEKTNWKKLQQTALFRITDEGCIDFIEHTSKRDADYQKEAGRASADKREAPKRDDAKDLILDALKGKPLKAADLTRIATDNGFSKQTLQRARKELASAGRIKREYIAEGQGKGTECYWKLSDGQAFGWDDEVEESAPDS